jgi:hypothetical protein
MNLRKVAALVLIAFGVLLYLVGILGVLWPRTQPGDVGLVSTSAIFALFGIVGLFVDGKPAAN